jgi:hypothetical protein
MQRGQFSNSFPSLTGKMATVAVGVPPAVEGGILPSGKPPALKY